MFAKSTERLLTGLERTLGPDELVEPERLLLGLMMSDIGMVRVMGQLGGSEEAVRAELMRLGLKAPQPPKGWTGGRPPERATRGPTMSWRGQAAAEAVLEAAILSRRAFAPARRDGLSALELEVLVRLALLVHDVAAVQPELETRQLAKMLDVTPGRIRGALTKLERAELVVLSRVDAEAASISRAGVERVARWLQEVAGLLGSWPPDQAQADDVIA